MKKLIFEFKSRIKEVIFKDGHKEYYPQIQWDDKEDWWFLRNSKFGNSFDLGLSKNDYKCLCKTKNEAIGKIDKFRIQRQKFEEINRKFEEREIERENSIKEINFLADDPE